MRGDLMDDIKRMDIKEFQEKGYLKEANRRFFHPLGLSLVVSMDTEDGSMELSGIQDHRDDPEGMVFDDIDIGHAEFIERMRLSREKARDALGCCFRGIQIGAYTPNHTSDS